MIVSTVTDTRHALFFEGLSQHGYVYQDHDGSERVLLRTLTVTVIVEADNRVRPMETQWSATGVPILVDGTLGKAARKPQGGNLNRLPNDLREIVLTAIEDLGVLGTREDLDRVLTPGQRARMEARD